MPITRAAIGLVDALFSAAIGNAVLSDGFSAHLRREVLWFAIGYALDVWIGFNEWKYISAVLRFEIGIHLLDMTHGRDATMPLVPQNCISSLHH
jgi:hypothetical protein